MNIKKRIVSTLLSVALITNGTGFVMEPYDVPTPFCAATKKTKNNKRRKK